MVDVEVREGRDLRDIARRGEARAGEGDVVAHVQEPHVRVGRGNSPVADLDVLGIGEEISRVDREAERTRDEHAVQVDLETVGGDDADAFPEPRGEVATRLAVAGVAAAAFEVRDGGVEVDSVDEDVDVAERTQRRIRVRRAGDHWSLQRAVADADARQDVARVDEQPFEDQVDREHGFVPAQRLVALRIARAQPAGVQRAFEVPGDALARRRVEERRKGRVVERDCRRRISAGEPFGRHEGHQRVE